MKFIKSLKGEDDGTTDDVMLKPKKRPPPFTPGGKSQFGLPPSPGKQMPMRTTTGKAANREMAMMEQEAKNQSMLKKSKKGF